MKREKGFRELFRYPRLVRRGTLNAHQRISRIKQRAVLLSDDDGNNNNNNSNNDTDEDRVYNGRDGAGDSSEKNASTAPPSGRCVRLQSWQDERADDHTDRPQSYVKALPST